MGEKTEWWLDGYRPSETALMLVTGAAVSSVETLVCVWRCVCLPNRANSVYWQTAVTSAQPGSFTSVVRHKHTFKLCVCVSLLRFPLSSLLFKFPSWSTHRDALHCTHTAMFQEGLQNMYMPGCLFFRLKKNVATNELPLSNAWSGTTSLSGSGWRHNTTKHNTILNRTVVCVWWSFVWGAGR